MRSVKLIFETGSGTRSAVALDKLTELIFEGGSGRYFEASTGCLGYSEASSGWTGLGAPRRWISSPSSSSRLGSSRYSKAFAGLGESFGDTRPIKACSLGWLGGIWLFPPGRVSRLVTQDSHEVVCSLSWLNGVFLHPPGSQT